MMDRWLGKTAVVTGAGAGIGAGITTALANAGIRVIALEKRENLIDELNSQGNSNIYPRLCDISKLDEVRDTFKWIDETFNGIHILVNNAGVLRQGHITDVGTDTISEDDILLNIDTIVKGTIICTRNAVAIMKRNNFDGHIININSLAGHYVPFASTLNVYPAAKNATVAFTQCLLNELSEFHNKIKVTSLSPGMVNTNMAAHMLSLSLPMLRPSNVADAILYVLSTPPNVNITELTIMSVTEKRL